MRKAAVLAAILASAAASSASDIESDKSASKSAGRSQTSSSKQSTTGTEGTGSAQVGGTNDVNAPAGNTKRDPLSKDDFSLKGKVSRVSAKSVTISRDDSTPATLQIDPATKIEVDGKTARASDLKPGDEVKAAFNLKGERPIAVELKASSKGK
jgi:hypothetical protein